MKVRELIQQLLNEDMDDEVSVEVKGVNFWNDLPIDGIALFRKQRTVILVPNKAVVLLDTSEDEAPR